MPLSYLELTARLILAILLGGIIGLERETINKPAGFRTHILVCLDLQLSCLYPFIYSANFMV